MFPSVLCISLTVIVFSLQVLALCFVRKGMDFFFSQEELKWLDDIMPETHKREKEDAKKKKEEELGEVCSVCTVKAVNSYHYSHVPDNYIIG